MLDSDVAARRAQEGQALVLGMVLAAALSLALLRYFAAGQVLAAKVRQVHGLDAAAYSGALVQARALNMLAYLNRAQLAHQLAMAHLATLASWALYGGAEAGQVARGNPPAYLIGMLFGADHGRAYLAAAQAAGLEGWAQRDGALGRAHAAHDRQVHDLHTALARNIATTVPEVRMAAVRAVLRAHYPDRPEADLRLSLEHDQWPSLLRRHAPDRGLHDLVQDIAGLYPFLGPRDHTARNTWVVDEHCPALRHQFRRRGATTLDAEGRWQASDTQSFHALRTNRWVGCYYREYAMAWGWIPAQPAAGMDGPYSDAAPEDFSEQDFWRWVASATDWSLLDQRDNPIANSYAVRHRPAWPAGGLGPYHEVATDRPEGVAGFELFLSIDGPEGLAVQARSAAHSYFARPLPRADGLDEAPNLFHPYWMARLAPLSIEALPAREGR
ncbi:hypothetical protein [Castellaniella sp. GW247-6E4]|uniref:hypothetical protein n=1 Tax=Castellaniella sp. GW247-6E4 TaxID=3140380 RepID=UPI0033145865